MKRDDETQTAFSIRLIRQQAWQEAHDECCDWRAGCKVHMNPYG